MSTPSPKDYTVLICHHVLYVDCILTGFIAYWSSNKILFCSVLFTSLSNCMMSSSVAMEILCITNIGPISSKKIADVAKNCCSFQIVFSMKISRKIGNVLENSLFKFKLA